MKNLSFLFLPLLLAFSCASKNSQQTQDTKMDNSYLFLLGTYTEKAEEGINLIEFNAGQEQVEVLSVASDIENPSFVISNARQDLVFAVEETGSNQGGKVTSFRFDKTNRSFNKINSVYTQGNSPCHISLDPSEQFLIASNYSGGNVTAIPVDKEGTLSEEIQTIQHTGSSINPDRQQSPHVHSAVFHPEENKVFVADLGTDKIHMYNFAKNARTPLSQADPDTFTVIPGSGPRHITFNQSGTVLYLVHEMTAEIGVYAYEDGKLTHIETHSLLPKGFTGKVGAAEVRISPDGNFLYASNRGEANDITVFQIEKENGQLSKVQNISSQGNAPRNFAITPDGKYMICGNQNSDKLVVFERNPKNGRLTPTSISLTVNKPVYIYFLQEN